MSKKYELTEYYIQIEDGTKLYRIRALRYFGYVKKGDLGGFIQKEDNLSHDGNCWVYDNARVSGNSWIHDDARVYSGEIK